MRVMFSKTTEFRIMRRQIADRLTAFASAGIAETRARVGRGKASR
jgi:hypothetical protein